MSNTLSASTLIIGTSSIRQIDGLYSLNDLHKASGGEEKHRPTFFLRLEQTQALIAEISRADVHTLKTVIGKGKEQGTYACKELVIAYAAWINPAFHLKVIRVFLAQVGRTLPTPETITKAQQGELATLIAERFPSGKDRPYAWSRFNNHFRLASYKDLPANRFGEACEYIKTMPGSAGNKESKAEEIMQHIFSLKDESLKAIAYACIDVLFYRTKRERLREAEEDLLGYFKIRGTK